MKKISLALLLALATFASHSALAQFSAPTIPDVPEAPTAGTNTTNDSTPDIIPVDNTAVTLTEPGTRTELQFILGTGTLMVTKVDAATGVKTQSLILLPSLSKKYEGMVGFGTFMDLNLTTDQTNALQDRYYALEKGSITITDDIATTTYTTTDELFLDFQTYNTTAAH